MLRYGGLGDAELRADDVGHRAGRLLAVREQFENAPANRVAEHVQRVHVLSVSESTYIRQE